MFTTPPPGSPTRHEPDAARRVVAGLEAIIDAAAGILSARSLEATLQAMADELAPIVPYTRLAVFEVNWDKRVCVPLLATGSYAEMMLTARPPLEGSATGAAVLSGELVYSGPGELGPAQVMPGTPEDEVESLLVAPLRIDGRVQATLNIWREALDGEGGAEIGFAPSERVLVERFASLATIAYANSLQREQLRTMALTDELTGLYNRRHFDKVLRSTLLDGHRRGEVTSIVYFDIDCFKAINDEFGHAAGDEALRAFARVLSQNTRAGDLACRTGGEEFVLVLQRTDAACAQIVAERVTAAVRNAHLGPTGGLTVSAGVAAAEGPAEDFDLFLQRADAALYAAKEAGRDCVRQAARPA